MSVSNTPIGQIGHSPAPNQPVSPANIAVEARKDTIFWMFLSSLFGAVQLIMLWIYTSVSNNVKPDGTVTESLFSWDNLLRDGVFIFFALSLVSSAIVDYLMDNVELNNKFKKAIVFVVPFIVVLIGSAVYAMLFVDKDGARNLTLIEMVILVSAYVYAYFTKFQTVCYKIANP